MILRCNQGVGAGRPCFVQKHPGGPRGGGQRAARDPSDASQHLAVADLAELVRLVQNGAVEIHAWGAPLRTIERPDRMIFDLDPHESVPWPRVIALAREVRDRLRALRLPAFVKTSGGKGLHLFVPLQARHAWDQVRTFANELAVEIAGASTGDVTLEIAKNRRAGKIFLDVLRNARGATCVVPYSPRARPGAAVSMPLPWTQLSEKTGPDAFTLESARDALRRADPWRDWERERARLPSLRTRRR